MPAKGARTIVLVELPLGLVDLCLGLQILRMLLDRHVGIAVELGQRHLSLLLQRSERLLRCLQPEARLNYRLRARYNR